MKRIILFVIVSMILFNISVSAQSPQLEMILPVEGSEDVHTISPIILESNYYIDFLTVKGLSPTKIFTDDTGESTDIFLLEKSIKDGSASNMYPDLAVKCDIELESNTRIRLKPIEALKPDTEYTLYVAYNAFKVFVPDGSGRINSTPVSNMEKSFKTYKDIYIVTSSSFPEIRSSWRLVNCGESFHFTLNQPLDPTDFDLQASDIFLLLMRNDEPPDSTGRQIYWKEVPCKVAMSEDNTAVSIVPNEYLKDYNDYLVVCDLYMINGDYHGNFSEQFDVKNKAVIKLTPITEDGSELTDHINVKPGIYPYVVRVGEKLKFDIPFETENYYLEEVRNPIAPNGIQQPYYASFEMDIDCDNLQDLEIFLVYKPIPVDCITIGTPILYGSSVTPEISVKGSGYISRTGNTFCAKRYSTTPLTISVTDTSGEYEFVGWMSSDGKNYGREQRLVLSASRLNELHEGIINSGDITLQPIFGLP